MRLVQAMQHARKRCPSSMPAGESVLGSCTHPYWTPSCSARLCLGGAGAVCSAIFELGCDCCLYVMGGRRQAQRQACCGVSRGTKASTMRSGCGWSCPHLERRL